MEIRYYATPAGNSPVRRFIEQMPRGIQEDFFSAIDRLRQGEHLDMPLSRPLYDIVMGLHELRFREKRTAYRVFYFIKKRDAIYLVHAIAKKTQKTPDKDRKLILRRLKEI